MSIVSTEQQLQVKPNRSNCHQNNRTVLVVCKLYCNVLILCIVCSWPADDSIHCRLFIMVYANMHANLTRFHYTWMRYAHVLSISCINNHLDFLLNFRYVCVFFFMNFEMILTLRATVKVCFTLKAAIQCFFFAFCRFNVEFDQVLYQNNKESEIKTSKMLLSSLSMASSVLASLKSQL